MMMPSHRRASSNSSESSSVSSDPTASSFALDRRSVTMPVTTSTFNTTNGHIRTPIKSRSSSASSASSSVVVHSGEVIASTGLLRGKKKDYVVLTKTELCRFKSKAKAADAFPSLGLVRKASVISNHSSIVNLTDLASGIAIDSTICVLERITAIYDVGPLHIEVAYLHENSIPHSTILQLGTKSEAEIWLAKLYAVIPKRTIAHSMPSSTVDTLCTYLKARKDYYEPSFKVFRIVIQHKSASHKSATSAEDLTKLANLTTHALLVVGHYAIHLLAVDSKPATLASSTLLPSHLTPLSSHGIVSLVHLAMSPRDSTFYLSFRQAFQPIRSLYLASCAAKDIIQHIRSCLEYLRPCWTEYPLAMDVPEYVQDEPLVPIVNNKSDAEDNGMNGFNTTLAAYCLAFGISTSIYNIAHDCIWDEDSGLIFRLLPPRKTSLSLASQSYTVLELLCVMRALRWNEAFGGISFAGISLISMVDLVDPYAAIELDHTRTANNRRISKFLKSLPVLKLEMQLMMLCSTALRMLDLNGCLPRQLQDTERGSGIVDALMQVAKRATSNVDSFVFSNIPIDLYDFDYLVDVASTRAAHLRNLEIAHCGLYERELTLLLQALEVHENTLEGLDISNNPGRVSVYSLNESLYRFQYLRTLYMRKLLITSEDLPLLSAETLGNMHLKRLVLDSTRLTSQSVSHLCRYLKTERATSLVQLSVQSCGLKGTDVGNLLSSMGTSKHKLHVDLIVEVGDNPICHEGFDTFVDSILELGTNVRRIAMPRIEFEKEQFLCRFLRALADPACEVTHLDLSFLLIPDADASAFACDILGEVVASNKTLVSLNLTGETSKLQVARIGHGIWRALARLSENSSLQELYIDGNELSVDGAMVLAKALTANRGLRKISIDDNGINLQGFTAIVTSIVDSENRVIKEVSRPEKDQAKQLRSLRELGRMLELEIAAMKQQKRASSSGAMEKYSAELRGKIEAGEKARETVAVLEREWSKVYDKLELWISGSEKNPECGTVENEVEEKSRSAWDRLKMSRGRKVSAGGRVIS
ncbi:hypothetical protein V1512DRAFT_238852 [Lipomyces arxii]|uniref:uncharacterized protein n=1 Tax=Lipomyces arxii TaxID=56418 RepID=UPI0034CD262C